jgi:ribose 5-phosphate isomerase B
MKIYLGNDHAGYDLKEQLKKKITSKGFEVEDVGAYSDESVDYPDFAHGVAERVEDNPGSLGVLICGSGNGVAMAANKHRDIRAALCWKPELASLARQHNNANVLCLPARFISFGEAEDIVDAFLEATFEGGRHARRVDKISC